VIAYLEILNGEYLKLTEEYQELLNEVEKLTKEHTGAYYTKALVKEE